MKNAFILSTAITLLTATSALAASPFAPLEVTLGGLDTKNYILPEYAFCVPAAQGHVTDGENKSPAISWKGAPENTKSYAIIAVDPDVPTVFDDAGKEGKTIPISMPRQDFYHWVLVNIPASRTSLEARVDTLDNNPHGKSTLQMAYGLRGINNYAAYMASNPDKKGVYAGYDGPCPPWNDERVHHYHFNVYALDVETLPIKEPFNAQDALAILQSHVLAKGEAVGLYSLNPAAKEDSAPVAP